jgi:hypothetical protein
MDPIFPQIFDWVNGERIPKPAGTGPFLPFWYISPPSLGNVRSPTYFVNINRFDAGYLARSYFTAAAEARGKSARRYYMVYTLH